jgi:hypothetical protein
MWIALKELQPLNPFFYKMEREYEKDKQMLKKLRKAIALFTLTFGRMLTMVMVLRLY